MSSTKSFLLCVGRFVVKVISSRRRSGEMNSPRTPHQEKERNIKRY
ncbi:TPA_asm: hypothetical protein [Porphyromonas phage phage027a_F0568]|uniref:Uncharacterized protein n=3 Tax=Viruses TaxID=10239 RepID=A0AAT9J950_9CAUD